MLIHTSLIVAVAWFAVKDRCSFDSLPLSDLLAAFVSNHRTITSCPLLVFDVFNPSFVVFRLLRLID
ncbi:unnamed protein product [Ceratitis capitata]|uniref:(Mediterranean fruit fly) hypothetical protein n=1 Tax=Ceratitis capitata TaxID=7213 RepID=A0A811UD44_CERCA|nr:unnamed protein product [Ceratitis capitata]